MKRFHLLIFLSLFLGPIRAQDSIQIHDPKTVNLSILGNTYGQYFLSSWDIRASFMIKFQADYFVKRRFALGASIVYDNIYYSKPKSHFQNDNMHWTIGGHMSYFWHKKFFATAGLLYGDMCNYGMQRNNPYQKKNRLNGAIGLGLRTKIARKLFLNLEFHIFRSLDNYVCDNWFSGFLGVGIPVYPK